MFIVRFRNVFRTDMNFMALKHMHALPQARYTFTLAVAMAMLLAPRPTSGTNGLCIHPGKTGDLGAFPAESNQTTTFTLSNTASNALHIEKLKSCCACLEPVIYETTIAPGTSTPLDVIIDAHSLNGPFKKSITLATVGTESQTIRLWIKGTAIPALSIPTSHVYAGHTAVNRMWSTNLAVAIRAGLPGKLAVAAQSNVGLEASLGKTEELLITIPPQLKPTRWQGTVLLRIEGQPQLPPVPIHLEGCIGGSLHPQPSKLVLPGNSPQATLTLYRKYPSAPRHPPPLQCTPSDIEIEEEYGDVGKSTVILKFPARFMQRLKTEKRIPIQLRSDGCIPASLILQHQP